MPADKTTRSISRRCLIQTAAVLAAGATVSGGEVSARGTGTGVLKNTQLSLAAYSRRQSLTRNEMDLFGFIDWCAELGVAGAELTSYYFKEDFDTGYLHQLRRHAFSKGITVSGTAIRNNFCLPPGTEKDREVRQVREWIDQAAELFAPHIRIFAGDVPPGADKAQAITWVADGVKAVLEQAERRGVILGLENHGGITARAADHLEICRQVGSHPWFGINLDTGNYRINAYEELAMAAPLAVNVQVKDYVFNAEGKREAPDLVRLAAILRKADYKGWIVLEYEGEPNPVTAVPEWLARMRQTFWAAG